MNQIALFNLIAKTVINNNKYVDSWYHDLILQVCEKFKEFQKMDTMFFCVFFESINKVSFKIVDLKDTSDEEYIWVIKQNFLHGYPLFCCSFVTTFWNTYESESTGETIDEELLYITCETPLRKTRQIYNIIEKAERKIIQFDEQKSIFMILPNDLKRFESVIQPPFILQNQN